MMPDVFPLFPSFQDRYVARAYICGAIAKVSSCINRSTCSRNPVLLHFISHGGQKKKKKKNFRSFKSKCFHSKIRTIIQCLFCALPQTLNVL